MRRRAALVAAALAWWAVAQAPALAQESRPLIRARLSPGGPVIVGQPVRLIVDVLVPNYFMGAPRWPDALDVPDAMARLDDSARANFTERIDGVTYAGQTREFVIYSQAPGSVAISPVSVPVRYARDSGGQAEATLTSQALAFEARVPEEAAALGYFFATSSFRLTERFDRQPEGLKVGDAFVRTITMTAVNSSAILLPPVAVAAIDGVAIYPGEPRVSDTGGERGADRTNERVERVSYVFQREGEVVLPAVSVSWWDTGAGRLRTASLPERTLSIAANPNAAPEISLPEEVIAEESAAPGEPAIPGRVRRLGPSVALALAVLAAAAWLIRRYGGRVRTSLVNRRRQRAASEAVCFARVRRASLGGDPRAAYAAALAWLDRASDLPGMAGRGAPTLAGLAAAAGRPDLAREQEALMARLFGTADQPAAPWPGRAFFASVAAARRAVLHRRSRPAGRGSTLPGLNPGSQRARPATGADPPDRRSGPAQQ